MDTEELLSPREAAKLLHVSVKTLYKWYRKGIIKAVRLPTGRLRYYKSDIERILRGDKLATA
jgi:putative resolvase